MTDTLINRLGGVRHLSVRSTDAVRRYANQQQNPIVAGRDDEHLSRNLTEAQYPV